MVLAEIVLYIFILFLFFFIRPIKKLFNGNTRDVSKSHSYDKIDKHAAVKPLSRVKAHYGFLVFLFLFTFIALAVLLTILWTVLRKEFIFTVPDAIYIGSSWGITFLPILFIALPVSNLILENLPFRTARYAARNHYKVPSLPHRLDIKLTLWIFIIFFALGFPFVILNTDYYSYVKDDEICINEFFSLSDNIYKIPAQVKYADVTYKEGLEDDYFYYTICMDDGKEIEILNENRFEPEKVVQIDDILVNNDVHVNRYAFSIAEWTHVQRHYIDSLTIHLKELYIIGK